MAASLRVKVKPGARSNSLQQQDDGSWLAQVMAPPVDGKANQALIALVARHFGLPRSRVRIRTGAGARLKLLELDDGADG